MFKMHGLHDGREFDVTWEDKKLSGDELAIISLEAAAPYRYVGPAGGPLTIGLDTLNSDSNTFLLAYQLFDNIELMSGELTQPEEVPEGAIP